MDFTTGENTKANSGQGKKRLRFKNAKSAVAAKNIYLLANFVSYM